MDNRAAVITVSDKGFRGEREDTSGPALCEMLKKGNWNVIYTSIIPDDYEKIRDEILKCSDDMKIPLVLTTGGTGFSPRDVTPEATLSVIERRTPGIPEAMRAYSMTITPRGCLSREEAGIRGSTLIINLPGSKKASTENFSAVIESVRHGIEMLQKTEGSADCGEDVIKRGVILSINISEHKGTRKHVFNGSAEFIQDYGIKGDSHAGNWHRQVSLLGIESTRKLQNKLKMEFKAGDFAENILTEGICLYELPVGTKIFIGSALCEVTQIGKECHNDCEIKKLTGECVMPREGIFVKVLRSGHAKKGDSVYVKNIPANTL